MKMRKTISMLLALLLFLPLVLPATGAWAAPQAAPVVEVHAVDENGDPVTESGDGLMDAINKVKNNKLRNVRYTLLTSFNVGKEINMIGESSDGTPITTLEMNGNTLTIQKNVTFQNVVIKGGSFVVDRNCTLTLDHVVFDNTGYTRTGSGGAVSASERANVTIEDSSLINCSVQGNGGAISMLNGTLQVKNSIFEKNKTVSISVNETHGGAIYLNGTAATVTDSTFRDNEAGSGGAGGAIMLRNGRLTVRRSVFSDNEAGWTGGAITTAWNKPKLNVYGTVFENNKAGQRGGAVTVRDGTEAVFLNDGSLPTRFIDNSVTNADDFAGGGLFIDASYVRMEDTLITENSARDGGGGLATCTTGTAQVDVMHGAAIYGNTVTAGSGSNPVHPEIQKYQDIFFHTRDHIDHNNNQNIPGRDNFPTDGMKYTLYERMFSGGLHRWNGKTYYMDNEGHKLESYIAQSNPTATADESKAKVIFKGNSVTSTRSDRLAVGGAIADNGLLEIGGEYKTTEIKIVKVWDGDLQYTGLRPSAETLLDHIELFAGEKSLGLLSTLGSIGASVHVLMGDEAKKTVPFSDIVLENDRSLEQIYSADEEKWLLQDETYWIIVVSGLPDGQTYSIHEVALPGYTSSANGLVLTNTLKTRNIDVSKMWSDAGHEGARPQEVIVRLLANGEETGQYKELRETTNWKGQFTNLPIQDTQGKEIDYTIIENGVSNYTAEYDQKGFSIKNTYNPGKTDVVVVKAWEDHGDQDGARPASVTVHLLADGKDTGKSLILNESNKWFGEFSNLDKTQNGKEIEYTVQEDSVYGYGISVTGDQKKGYTIVNRYEPEKTSLTVTKIWNHGDHPETEWPQSITVRLHANGEEIETRQVRAADDWMVVFENLPKYEGGEKIDYTVTEDHVAGYTHEINEDTDTIINTYNPGKTDLEVEKEWMDEHDRDGIRPNHVTVHLLANGQDTGKALVLEAKDHWHGEFEKLDERDAAGNLIRYTVREDPVAGYRATVTGDAENGYVIVNLHEPKPEVRFAFKKVWSGGVGGEISFRLYSADGKPLDKDFHKKVISATEWQYESWFNTEEGAYLIEEPVSGYMIRYENKGKYAHVTDRLYNGGKIINTKVPQTGDGERPALWMALTAAGILGLAVLIASKRRRRRNV